MNLAPDDEVVLRQLAGAWRQRAESIRRSGGASGASLARADTFDICAAQLAQAVEAIRSVHDRSRDAETLSLFPYRDSA